MRIVFLNPPFFPRFSRTSRSPAVAKSGTIYYPFWLALAAGYAGKAGHDIDLIDAPAAGLERKTVFRRIEDFSPHIVVVETSTPSVYNDVGVADELKRRLPDTVLILAGTHVSALPQESMGLGELFDGIALREYDETVLEAAEALATGKPLASVQGLALRNGSEMQHTGLRKPIKNLDDFPFVTSVYKEHLRIEDYFFAAGLYPQVMIITGRGCPFGCRFCVYPQTFHGRGYRPRSAKNIIEEFAYIAEELPQVKEVNVEDDTFTINKKRVREICQGIIERKIRLSWTVNTRADLSLDTMKLMKAAGCRLLIVGYESGSEKVLERMNKGITLAEIEQFAINARRAKLLVHGCFMVGNPGDNRQTLRETLDMALKLKPDTAQFFPLMVYPGTETYDWAKENNLIRADRFDQWNTPDGLHNCVIGTPDMTPEELVAFCDYARRKFYLHPSYLLKKGVQVVTHPAEFRRTIKSFRVFAKHLFK